jgi:hypothetical protein
MMTTPTAQNIAGLSSSGNVTITKDFLTDAGAAFPLVSTGKSWNCAQRRTWPGDGAIRQTTAAYDLAYSPKASNGRCDNGHAPHDRFLKSPRPQTEPTM